MHRLGKCNNIILDRKVSCHYNALAGRQADYCTLLLHACQPLSLKFTNILLAGDNNVNRSRILYLWCMIHHSQLSPHLGNGQYSQSPSQLPNVGIHNAPPKGTQNPTPSVSMIDPPGFDLWLLPSSTLGRSHH